MSLWPCAGTSEEDFPSLHHRNKHIQLKHHKFEHTTPRPNRVHKYRGKARPKPPQGPAGSQEVQRTEQAGRGGPCGRAGTIDAASALLAGPYRSSRQPSLAPAPALGQPGPSNWQHSPSIGQHSPTWDGLQQWRPDATPPLRAASRSSSGYGALDLREPPPLFGGSWTGSRQGSPAHHSVGQAPRPASGASSLSSGSYGFLNAPLFGSHSPSRTSVPPGPQSRISPPVRPSGSAHLAAPGASRARPHPSTPSNNSANSASGHAQREKRPRLASRSPPSARAESPGAHPLAKVWEWLKQPGNGS